MVVIALGVLFLLLFHWNDELEVERLYLVDNLWNNLDGVALVGLLGHGSCEHVLLVFDFEVAELVLSVTFALTERSGRGGGGQVLGGLLFGGLLSASAVHLLVDVD